MKPETIRTTTTIKPRTGLAQTLLAAAALLGLSLLLVFSSGCGRDEVATAIAVSLDAPILIGDRA